ncbi:serine/threonine-protein kinase, partial [Planctomycetota bacterium]|nr:serine/threonine-protein kinase [Planctomycetota bacterium]
NVDGRVVAMKRIRTFDAADRVMLQRFEQERGTIAGLNHANVVTVYDAGEDGLGPYLVMEFVEGAPLDELLRDDPPGEDLAVAIFEGLCRGVAHAHKRGVIHRDIKPSNVILDGDGTPKLLDFGLARGAVGLELSMTGYGMGTLDYSAPEQKRDAKSVDERADIYSLGATFYELLTGLKPVPLHIAKAPARWQGIVARCCEPSPDDRFASVADVLAGLKEARERTHASTASAPRGDEDDLRCPAPACRQVNALDARHCRACGEGLFAPCPACEQPCRVGIAHCDKCGAHVDGVRECMARLEAAQQALEEGRLGVVQREVEAGLSGLEGRRLGGAADLPIDLGEVEATAERRRSDAERLLTLASGYRNSENYESALRRLREAAKIDASNVQALEQAEADLEGLIVQRDARVALRKAKVLELQGSYDSAIQEYRKAARLDGSCAEAAEHGLRSSETLRSLWGLSYGFPISVLAAFMPSNHRKVNEILSGADGSSTRAKQLRAHLRAILFLTLGVGLATIAYVSGVFIQAVVDVGRVTDRLRSSETLGELEEARLTAERLKADRWALLASGATSPPHPRSEQWGRLFASRWAELTAEAERLTASAEREFRDLIRECTTRSSLLELRDRSFESPAWSAVYEEWSERVCDLTLRELTDARAAIIAAEALEDLEGIRIPPVPLSHQGLTQQRAEVALLLADRRRELAAGGSD